MIEFLGLPRYTGLVNVIRLKAELGITTSGDDALLQSMVTAASHAIMAELLAPPWRARYRESALLVSSGSTLVLGARPIARILAATVDGGAYDISNLSIRNADQGIVRVGSLDQAGAAGDWTVDSLAGWFVEDDNYVGTVGAEALNSAYTCAAGDFNTYLAPGDWVQASGFTNAENNGPKRIVSADASEIRVEQALVDEAAAPDRAFALRTLPGPLERACVETVRTWYLQRRSTSAAVGSLIEKSIGSVTERYSDPAAALVKSSATAGIPLTARALCRPYALVSP